jgi:type IVB pilus formation R64 PilN family outer membrane protein
MRQNSNRFLLSAVSVATGLTMVGCASTSGVTERASADVGKKAPIALAASAPLLGEIDGKPRDLSQVRGSSQHIEAIAKLQQDGGQANVARSATRPFYGARTITIQDDEVLPPVFARQMTLNFDDVAARGRVSISVVAERLSRLTGVPVRVKQDVFAGASSIPSAASTPVAQTPVPLPSGATGGPLPMGQPAFNAPPAQPIAVTDVNSVEMKWDGTLARFLDHLTGRLGLSWAYRDGGVMIERFITETFEVAGLAGQQDFKFSMQSASSGTSGGTSNAGSNASGLDVNEAGRVEVMQSLLRTVNDMVSATPGSRAFISDGTARIVVTTTKDQMSRVREVLAKENASLMRSVVLEFDIYAVTSEESSEAGINWNVLFTSISQRWGASLTSPASLTASTGGGVTFNILQNTSSSTNTRYGGSSAVIAALAERGLSVQHRPVTLFAMNRQWARKTNLRQTGYLQETTAAPASSTGGGGTPGLKTGSVTTGDTFVAQPAILDNGTVLLKFGIGLTDLIGLFDVTTGSGLTSQKVQTPEISGTTDQSTVPLKPGEILVLTGMSRIRSNSDRRTLSENAPIGIGGSRKASHSREDFVIVVRPTLL